MASGLDLVLEGIRSVGEGASRGIQAYQTNRERSDRRGDIQKKEEAQKILQDRLGNIVSERDALTDEIKNNPDFDMETFIERSQGIVKGAAEIGQPEVADTLLKDPRTLLENREKNKRATAQATASAVKEGKKASKEEQDLEFKSRAEIRSIKDKHSDLSKNTRIRGESFKQIQTVAEGEPSAAGDLSLIFSYMKVLDPPSTVREGEQALAENARGVPDTIRNMYNKVLTGERLTPEQRQDFANQAEGIYRSALNDQKLTDKATMEELQEIAGGDKKKMDLFKKKVFARTAEEELSELDAKKKTREEKDSKPSGQGQMLKKISVSAADQIRAKPEVQAQFKAAVDKVMALRQAKGNAAPLTPGEMNALEIAAWKKLGYTVVPDQPTE